MNLKYEIKLVPYRLHFKFEAGTSRGVLTEKTTYFLLIKDKHHGLIGVGEAGPLPNLSIDDVPDFYLRSQEIIDRISIPDNLLNNRLIFDFVSEVIPSQFPSLRFAFETALLDLLNGGRRTVFVNDFIQGNSDLWINGLIWMGDEHFMLHQIEAKLNDGFRCLKMKIGAIDFEKECAILKQIRTRYDSKTIELRVDANGAFATKDALEKLKRLSTFDLHSIEQPIRQGQLKEMSRLCKQSPVPIALDEELIGKYDAVEKNRIIQEILPQFIILKPTLLGGFNQTNTWISIAEKNNVGWWITSALESNVGLSAISQYVAGLDTLLPQGLGTGQLYSNNLTSPLALRGERLSYNLKDKQWDLSSIEESLS